MISMPAAFFNHGADWHFTSLHFLTESSHTFDDFHVRKLLLLCVDSDKHRHGNPVPRYRQCFAA
jgi:hypothetical protein